MEQHRHHQQAVVRNVGKDVADIHKAVVDMQVRPPHSVNPHSVNPLCQTLQPLGRPPLYTLKMPL
eukprot:53669-Prorocentrum_minimum.AAC.1